MKKLFTSVICMTFALTTYAQETSVACPVSSGFNQDMITESALAAPQQRGPLDTHGSQLILSTVGEPGIPPSLSITTTNGHEYKFADPSQNNCLTLTRAGEGNQDNNHCTLVVTEGTLTLTQATTPGANKLGFLVVGTNKENYALTYTAKVNYTDNTSTGDIALQTGDWGQSPSDKVYESARWRVTAGSNPETGFRGSLCEQTVDIDATKSVKSVTFKYTITQEDAWGWGFINIFGITAITDGSANVNNVAADNAAPAVKKYVEDHGIVIEKGGKKFTAVGAQLK